jgi:YVTN family beta-propeller protein
MRARSIVVATLLVAGALIGLMGTAGAASPAPIAVKTTGLPGGVGDMVVDAARGRVFVSHPFEGRVTALNLDGDVVGSVTGLVRPFGLALVGAKLYVALVGSNAIGVIDTTTLAVTTLAAGNISPGLIAAAGGYLWATTGDCLHNDDVLLRVTPSDGTTKAYHLAQQAGTCVGLAADPVDPTTLLMWSAGSSSRVTTYDVSTDPPTVVTTRQLDQLDHPQGLTVLPDGQTFVATSDAAGGFFEVGLDDLQPTGLVRPLAAPVAVAATSGAGGLVAGSARGEDGGSAIVVYPLRGAQPLYEWHTDRSVVSRGLRFSPDGSRVFAVVAEFWDDEVYYDFTVLTLTGEPPATSQPTTRPGKPRTALSEWNLDFAYQRVGTYDPDGGQRLVVRNEGTAVLHISDIRVIGEQPLDFFGDTDCPASLAVAATCTVDVFFGPTGNDQRRADLAVYDDAIGSPHTTFVHGSGTEGYILAGSHGDVDTFGDAEWQGDASGLDLAAPVVGLARTSNGDGYWLLGRDGGIFSYGNAGFYGSTGGIPLNRPVMTMAPTPFGGKGYWLAATDGGIFAFGNAGFFGSTGAIRLNKPVVGMAPTPSGLGYWLVASDGGIFAFGDASFYGSTGATPLNKPIIGMMPTPGGRGYWLVASDGGMFAFGDARFYGSTAGKGLRLPIVGAAASPTGRGYWLAGGDGGVFEFGDAPFLGSLADQNFDDVVGIVGTAPMLDPRRLGAAAAATEAGSQGPSLLQRRPGPPPGFEKRSAS